MLAQMGLGNLYSDYQSSIGNTNAVAGGSSNFVQGQRNAVVG